MVTSRVIIHMQMVAFVNATTLFPKNMCVNEGIADMLTFSKGNMLSDLKDNYDGFMNNIFRRKMSEDVNNLLNQRIFSGYFAGTTENVTYISYLLFFKSVYYDWLSRAHTSVSNYFYAVIVPNYLYSVSFSGIAQVYGPVAVFVSRQVENLKEYINMLNILSIIAIISVFGLMVIFRIRDGR